MVYPATDAPGLAAGFEHASISCSVSTGMMGATSTPTGTPASASTRMALSFARSRSGARFEHALHLVVERGDAEHHARETVAREFRQQVHVARDQRALGGDGDRVFVLEQHLEQRTCDFVCFFERLVWIGVGAEHDGRAFVARRGEFFFENGGGVGFVEKFGFEIEAGREADVGVAGAGVAVNAAMIASPIRIDRLREEECRATGCG